MPDASIEDLARASKAVGEVIAHVRADQWTSLTPCTEWNVRDVVNHLVAINLAFTARLTASPRPERGADHLGDDPIEAYQTSTTSLLTAFASPGVLQRSYPGPVGSTTGAEWLQIRLNDLITHGWDIAQATGSPARIPGELAEQGLAFAREQLSIQPRTGRFAEPQPIAETAPAIDRLAAFLGREVPPQP